MTQGKRGGGSLYDTSQCVERTLGKTRNQIEKIMTIIFSNDYFNLQFNNHESFKENFNKTF